MDDRPPFDLVRAAFWLLAAILGVEGIVVLASVGACVIHSAMIISDPNVKCDPDNRLGDLLTGALAVAMALLVGGVKKP